MKIKKFEFNMFPVNCYVLSDETNECVIIDAGCYYEQDKQALKAYIDSNGLQVKHLLNTHLHLDHIFGNSFVYKTYGVKPEAHQEDEFWLTNAVSQAMMFGLKLSDPIVELGKYLVDGEIIRFGNAFLKTIHVPGHSPGGLAFYAEKEGCLFSGDSLFHGSIGRADLAGGNFDTLKEAICNRLLALPDKTIVYPGHGDTTTIGDEKLINPFLR